MPDASPPEFITFEHPVHVAGLAVRTSNAAEADPATAQIPLLWDRFFAEGYADLSEGRTRYCVYTDYDPGPDGSYKVIIGAEKEGATNGLAEVEIPPGQYLVFTGAGELPESVISGWSQIWRYFRQPDAPERAYTVDYEEYDPLTPNEVRIHIALK